MEMVARVRRPTALLRALALGRCGGVAEQDPLAAAARLEPHVPPVRVLLQLTTTRRACWLPKSPLFLLVIMHAPTSNKGKS